MESELKRIEREGHGVFRNDDERRMFAFYLRHSFVIGKSVDDVSIATGETVAKNFLKIIA